VGSIAPRPETGHLFLDFRYRGIRCREQTALSDTAANRKRLQTVLDRIEAEITLGTFEYGRYFPDSTMRTRLAGVRPDEPGCDLLFQDFVAAWLARKAPEWRRSHITAVNYMVEHYLLPVFGRRPVRAITKTDILDFRAEILKRPGVGGRDKLSPRTVNHILAPLRMALRAAAEQYGWATPYVGIKSLRVPRSHVEPFTLEEVQLILDHVRSDFRNYYTVRFFTGMRPGEIDGLKWKFVDFKRRQNLVRETWVKGRVEYTKTEGSQREIDLSTPVCEALRNQWQATGRQEYVFTNSEGQPLDSKNVANRVWYPLLRHLDLCRRVPYQTRHTAATLWLAAGENPEWIARQMGHTTTEMLFRVYSRFVPNLTRQDGSAFEKLLESHRISNPPTGSP